MSTCVITGASSGIGQAAAVAISKLNEFDNIVLISRREDELQNTRDLMAETSNIIACPFDLQDLEAIPSLVEKIFEQCGSIDSLVNVAGYTEPEALLTTTLENMQKTYAINVFAPFLLIRECVKYMKDSAGDRKILNVASTAGITPRPGWLSYASSKASVISISSTLSEELAEYKIRVYCISPGRCATALRKKLAPDEDPRRIMQPDEVGHIIAELISRNEHCLDGQNIIIKKRNQ